MPYIHWVIVRDIFLLIKISANNVYTNTLIFVTILQKKIKHCGVYQNLKAILFFILKTIIISLSFSSSCQATS